MDELQHHGDREHADFAPSGIARTIACHGSHEAQAGIPDIPNAFSEEGTECHEAAASILEGVPFEKATAFLTDEQEWIVEEYTDYVFTLIDSMRAKYGDENVIVWIEQRVKSKEPGFEKNHGTADCVVWVKPLRTVAVIDLKAGFVPVDVGTAEEPLPQLANYGFLVLDHHDLWKHVDKVRLTIVQPRAYAKPQTLVVSKDTLIDFAVLVAETIQTIEAGDTTRKAGKHCKYCKARGRCPALREDAVKSAQMVFDESGKLAPARNYTEEELASILEEAELMQLHIDGVKAHAMRELEKGRFKGQGFKLVAKRATAKWTKPDELLAELSAIGARHLAFKPKMLTPNQLASVLKKEDAEMDLTDYFVKESSGYSLARDDDPRGEITPDPFGEKP